MATDVKEFIGNLDGGVLEQKLARMLSDVAAAVVVNEKTGKIKIDMTIKQIGSGSQVMVDHKLTYTKPTSKGSVTEDNMTNTPMYVGSNGDMTLMPEQQQDMFDKKPAGKVQHLHSA